MSDPTDIFAWLRFDEHLTTSGQPREDQIAKLHELGVRHVVNLGLHTHPRALPDEVGAVAQFGMNYVHIPVDFDAPTEEDFDRFCDVMARTAGERVHVHCIVNARVTAFLYRYRCDILGIDEARARAEMERIWSPGGVWAAFIGDEASIDLPHRGPASGT
jgi:protein tyrosine phosphatase (PTP) superfamily phosphohydrolase (DUF442 family)